jgi:hypothetical protein
LSERMSSRRLRPVPSRIGISGPRRLTWGVATLASLTASLVLAGSSLAAQGAQAAAPSPSFSTTPSIDPAFVSWAHDYAIRCDQAPVSVNVKVPAGWRGQVGAGHVQSSNFTTKRTLTPGNTFIVKFLRAGQPSSVAYYHVRCLPANFPPYSFTRTGKGGPPFIVMQMNGGYAAIFDSHGVPVWWYKVKGTAINSQLLRDGTVSWDPIDPNSPNLTGNFVVRTLEGRLVRIVRALGGPTTDLHELELLPNGNYLLAGQVIKSHVDTSAYGGSSDASIMGFEIQEVTPHGKLVWKWDSLKHIGLGQTPMRWWNQVVGLGEPYDIQHWNSAEVDGNHVLLSFRNLDAVYEINRDTGGVVWKLGGTTTPKSLTVLNDPQGSYPLSGQHDARELRDGTFTISDNMTNLGPPRAVRYAIDPQAGTATLLESISDPDATESPCCGSARKLPSGDWLIGWGRTPTGGSSDRFVGVYMPSGRRIFKLEVPNGFFYRAYPVAEGALTAAKLRAAMNAMAR